MFSRVCSSFRCFSSSSIRRQNTAVNPTTLNAVSSSIPLAGKIVPQTISNGRTLHAAAQTNPNTKTKILILYYSTYGHVAQLAAREAKGASSAGAEVRIAQFPETLSADILQKVHALPKNPDHPNATLNDLTWADGLLIGFPTRFGVPPAQFKAFWDGTGGLWAKNALLGKPFSLFFSTGTQGGGQESTALTSMPNFVHHGMVFVPIGYSDASLFNMDEVHGGSPYGAGTFAGATGARQPTALELGVAEHQGKFFTETATAFKVGREALAKK